MLADCHMHTYYSSDSETPMEEQVKRAIAMGMPHICFTDHMDIGFPTGEFLLDTEAYWEEIKKLQEKYKEQISIGFGVEVGLQEHVNEEVASYLSNYPFDYVIGSVHLMHGQDPYDKEIFKGRADEDVYRDYFEVVLENLKNVPGVQSLGHLDYVVRYGEESAYSYEKFADIIDEILKVLIEKDIALEVNTGGLKALSFPNPHPDVLRRYKELGGKWITLGADGHTPDTIGYGYDKIVPILKESGFDSYVIFKQKEKVILKL